VVDLAELIVLVSPCSEVDEHAAAGQRLGEDRDPEVRRRVHREDHRLDDVVAQQVVAGAPLEVRTSHPRDVRGGEQAGLRGLRRAR
jgi:hypothetical protein